MNGQAVYPAGPPVLPPLLASGSHQQLPPGLMGHPNYPLSAFHGALVGPPPFPFGMNHIYNPSLGFPPMPGSFQAPPMASNQVGLSAPTNTTMNPTSTNAPQPPSAPPISSIRPSEISRKQIEMLRSSLKYHEDQLMYNRHQIDEKEMEHTIQMLQSQIDRFEALNQSQLRFEESHYPKKEVKDNEQSGPHPRGSIRGSESNASFQGTVKHASGSSTRRSDSFRRRQIPRRKEPLFNSFLPESSLLLTDPVKKSTLPSKAALAPPFEPRSYANETKAEVSRPCGSFQWDGAAVDDGTVTNQAPEEGTVRGPGQNRQCYPSSSSHEAKLGMPYLVGKLPTGIDPKTAKESDYTYERELTPDETRARYLYWGRAPSFTRRGLPRFDGKNFYHASPGEETHRDSLPPPLLARSNSIEDPSVDFCTGAFEPKNVPDLTQAGAPGQYTSNFRRERQKTVKVTLVSFKCL